MDVLSIFHENKNKNVLTLQCRQDRVKERGYSLVKREQLGSRLSHHAFFWAGCAIGCGNVWKFPWMCGQNGGGSFMLVYILCLILLGIPALVLNFPSGEQRRQALFMYKNWKSPDRNGASSAGSVWQGISL